MGHEHPLAPGWGGSTGQSSRATWSVLKVPDSHGKEFDTFSRKQWVMNTNWCLCHTQAMNESQKKKGIEFPRLEFEKALVRTDWRSSTIKICHSEKEWAHLYFLSVFGLLGFWFWLFGLFFKEELKPSSQSARCWRQNILMVWLLNTLWIFTVDQQKVMKHRCSCNCDTLGKVILLNEPQLHTSTCVMWKCTGGTQGYNRGYVGMITGWFRTC